MRVLMLHESGYWPCIFCYVGQFPGCLAFPQSANIQCVPKLLTQNVNNRSLPANGRSLRAVRFYSRGIRDGPASSLGSLDRFNSNRQALQRLRHPDQSHRTRARQEGKPIPLLNHESSGKNFGSGGSRSEPYCTVHKFFPAYSDLA